MGYNRKQWILLVFLGLVEIFISMIYSLQGPFFPAEAESRNATATEYGFVFGCYELTVILASPFVGSVSGLMGVKLAFTVGVLLTAGSTILFGLLNYIREHVLFITLAFIFRIFEAIGFVTAMGAIYSFAGSAFPESPGPVFGILETTYGVGIAVGPAFGSLLYELGQNWGFAFPLPFITVGVLTILVSSIFTCCFFNDKLGSQGVPDTKLGFLSLLKIPAVPLYSLFNVVCGLNISWLQPLLAPHMTKLHVSQLVLGSMFLVLGGAYAVTSPVVGYLADRVRFRLEYFVVLSTVLSTVSFLVLGPAPFIPIQDSVGETFGLLAVVGISLGGLSIPGYLLTLRSAWSTGFAKSDATYGHVTALYLASLSFGAFVGPSLGGVLYDQIKFPDTALVFACFNILLLLITVLFICLTKAPEFALPQGVDHGENGPVNESTKLLKTVDK